MIPETLMSGAVVKVTQFQIHWCMKEGSPMAIDKNDEKIRVCCLGVPLHSPAFPESKPPLLESIFIIGNPHIFFFFVCFLSWMEKRRRQWGEKSQEGKDGENKGHNREVRNIFEDSR